MSLKILPEDPDYPPWEEVGGVTHDPVNLDHCPLHPAPPLQPGTPSSATATWNPQTLGSTTGES